MINGKSIGMNQTILKPRDFNYPLFTLGETITDEQRKFFDAYGFLHFRPFISKEMVSEILKESERVQAEWIAEDRKLVHGVPVKYGKDIDGKKIVQRFAFLNQYSPLLADFLKDKRFEALFDLIGAPDCRIGINEKDGLVFNHYINTDESNYSQLGWHTDSLRDVFYGQRIMPMLNVGVHLDRSYTDNGGLRLLPGTHNRGIKTILFHKMYFGNKPDENEVGLNVEPGDLTIHDGRLWHRVAQSPYSGETSRRRVMYVPIISGKVIQKTEESKPRFYQRFMALTNK
jgi:ectoine hydroxylase-related dioxygenase (phytanoyl-CoA dioxygenase family)